MKPSSLEITLSRCKSRVIIEDPLDIEKALDVSERQAQGRTWHHRNSDGELRVHKLAGATVKAPAMPSLEQVRELFAARGMPTDDDALLMRTMPYWMSDERADSEGDIVRQNWDFELFKTNSPVPAGHDWVSPPVGRMIDWKVVSRSEEDYNGKALWGLAAFADTPNAENIFRLVKTGFLPSGSVGFMPKRIIRIEDEEEREKLGLGPFGLIFDKNLLLEYSVVTLPANPGAHQIAASRAAKGLYAEDIDLLVAIKRDEVEHTNSERAAEEFATWKDWIFDVAKSAGLTKAPVKDAEADAEEDEEDMDAKALTEALERFTKTLETNTAVLESLTYDVQDALDTFSKGQPSPERADSNDDGTDPDGDGENSGDEDEVLASLRGHLDLALGNIEKLKGHTAAQ